MSPTDPSHLEMRALHPDDSLLRLIADSVPALIAYYHTDTLRCQFANRRYAEYNGWTPQTILGKTVREAIGEPAWQVIEPHVIRVVAGETVQYVREQTPVELIVDMKHTLLSVRKVYIFYLLRNAPPVSAHEGVVHA